MTSEHRRAISEAAAELATFLSHHPNLGPGSAVRAFCRENEIPRGDAELALVELQDDGRVRVNMAMQLELTGQQAA